jgi:hypothetical protein
MRTLTIAIALIVSIALSAQTPGEKREVTDSGVLIMDSTGRAVRFEGTDGVVVEYLYVSPGLARPSRRNAFERAYRIHAAESSPVQW